jgi:hypothetical protein
LNFLSSTSNCCATDASMYGSASSPVSNSNKFLVRILSLWTAQIHAAICGEVKSGRKRNG